VRSLTPSADAARKAHLAGTTDLDPENDGSDKSSRMQIAHGRAMLSMNMAERRNQIAEMADAAGSISLTELKRRYPKLSEMTLRRDLNALDAQQRIVRVYGGARSVKVLIGTDDLFTRREERHGREKQLIAQKAVAFIRPNMSIFMDSGTTMLALSKVLPNERYLLFLTGLNCAVEASRLSMPEMYMVGGRINHYSFSTCGARSLADLEGIRFDLAFLGATGYAPGGGFCCGSDEERLLKRRVIESAQKSVVLMDSHKAGVSSTFTYASPGVIDVLISDDGLSEPMREELKRFHVTIC
jgi:DeoR family transcriptional regulator of aga operon